MGFEVRQEVRKLDKEACEELADKKELDATGQELRIVSVGMELNLTLAVSLRES